MRQLKTVPIMHWTLSFSIALCSMAHVRLVVLGERVLVFELGDEGALRKSLNNSRLRPLSTTEQL